MKCKVLIVLLILKICYSQQSAIKPEARIKNGVIVGNGDIKYQVSIRLKSLDSNFGEGHICGGTLIGPNKVVTAAHCLYNFDKIRYRKPNEFSVVMGTMNRKNRVDGTIVSDVTSIAAYPDSYNKKTMRDDVGLLFLATEAPAYDPYGTIEPIELTNSTTASGEIGRISGWGLTNNGLMSDVLHMANVTMITKVVCKRTYGPTVTEGMICAAFENGGTSRFQGDSGGPLVYNNTLIGIISWGNGTAQRGSPGVYTDVYHYRDWITSKNSATQLVWSTFGVVLVILANLLL